MALPVRRDQGLLLKQIAEALQLKMFERFNE